MNTPIPPRVPGSASYASVDISKLSLGTIVNQRKTGTLTAAQILTMFGTALEILPDLAAGYMYVVDKLVLETEYDGVAFGAGGTIALNYGTAAAGTNYAAATVASTFLTAGFVDQVTSSAGVFGGGVLSTTVVDGVALSLTNAAAAFTLGTGAVITYHVDYKVVPVTTG